MATASPFSTISSSSTTHAMVSLSQRRGATQVRAGHAHHPGSLHLQSGVVSIPFTHLANQNADVSEQLEAGFGPSGMGIIAISNVPGFSHLRSKLLSLAQTVAYLPDNVLGHLEDPVSRYSFGWSHGKESLEDGQPDNLKGSFYANPLVDKPTCDLALVARYPSYCRPNIWPTAELPELEPVFKELGSLVVAVGLLLAHHCDKHVSSQGGVAKLGGMLERSLCHKGRLLHYYSCNTCEDAPWCGWHVDHGALTGLTCAMYTKDGVEVPCPDPKAGLYIRTRAGDVIKATFGKDDIAYQVGQATEILSKGLLHATPHCVRAAVGVERNTFAVFMQPPWDEPLFCQEKQMTFGDFSESVLSKYYADEQPDERKQ